MSRVICFIFALALLMGGIAAVCLFPGSKLALLAGALCATLGAVWLWADFIGPMLGRGDIGAEPVGTEAVHTRAVAAERPVQATASADLLRRAEAGDAEAQDALGLWYAANLPGTRQAEIWFRRAADQGLPKAQHNMGVLVFRAGRDDEATAWFEKAAAGGWAPSMLALAALLEDGGNIPRASELYEAAARQGDADAQDALGRLALDEGTETSHERARHWSEQAAKQGQADSQARLGTIYHEGLGVERDPQQAASWFLKAAQRGHAGAQMMIGAAYHLGIGVEVDLVAAARWLAASAEQGNDHARAYLKQMLSELTPDERLRLRPR